MREGTRFPFPAVNMSRKHGLFFVVLFYLCSITPVVTTSAPVFPIGSAVAVSPFTEKDSVRTSVSFSVRPEVIAALQAHGNSLFVAHESGPGTFNIYDPGIINETSGTVSLTTQRHGRFVVMTDAWWNDLPVVTHWDQSGNSGRGIPRVGACDHIGTIHYDTDSAALVDTTHLFDNHPGSPYYFTTDYALFSNDPDEPEALVPSYERYVGENYSIYGLTETAVSYFMHAVLDQTGFPVIIRNYPRQNILQNIPAFQVYNGVVLESAPGKSSLASVVLPPYWNRESPASYPVVLNSYYDVNKQLYSSAPYCMKVVAALHDEGITTPLWVYFNSGGAVGGTAHRSLYDNVSRCMSWLESNCSADIQSVITYGVSRGGSTALRIAGNPYHHTYRVRYVISYSAAYSGINEFNSFFDPTYPHLGVFLSNITGYRSAWLSTFSDSEYGTLRDRVLYNCYGTTSIDSINTFLAVDADTILQKLKHNKTSLLLVKGTHDSFSSFHPSIAFFRKLRSYDIPVKYSIIYRIGHHPDKVLSPVNAVEAALKAMQTHENRVKTGITFIRRKHESEPRGEYIPFSPSAIPFFFEGPKAAVHGLPFTLSIVGRPGSDFLLRLWKIDDRQWDTYRTVFRRGAPLTLLEGTLPPEQEWIVDTKVFSPSMQTGLYLYELWYRLPESGQWIQVPEEMVAQPIADSRARRCTVRILEKEPDSLSGADLAKKLSPDIVGWGLSEK